MVGVEVVFRALFEYLWERFFEDVYGVLPVITFCAGGVIGFLVGTALHERFGG